MFEEAIALFGEYYRFQDANNADFNKELGVEVSDRLAQLNRVVMQIRRLEQEFGRLDAETPSFLDHETWAPETDISTWAPEHKELYAVMQAKLSERISVQREMRDWTEAFYYFAFRTRDVIRLLPELSKFESRGIRDVRNHLLEHPEKQSKVLINSFSWGAELGPQIKGLRYDYQKNISVDAGLYPNALEFRDNLVKKLSAVLNRDTQV